MDIQQIKHNIEQNLIALYLTWKDYPSVSFFENEQLSSIQNSTHFWPNYLLNKNIDKHSFLSRLQEVNYAINNKRSKFWLLNSDLAFANESDLRQASFFPIKSWKGMYVNKTTFYKIEGIEDFEIEIVNSSNLKYWISIVNAEIYQKSILNLEIFRTKLDNPNFQFYIGKYKGEIVATSLSYFDGTSVGLYYVATKNTHRKKGFGTALVKKTFNDAIAKGNTHLVLHATKMAVPLYEKLGFTAYNQLIVFTQRGI